MLDNMVTGFLICGVRAIRLGWTKKRSLELTFNKGISDIFPPSRTFQRQGLVIPVLVPFKSHVLLVKKVCGSLRMAVGYLKSHVVTLI
jgi:hypothetical protein